MSGTGTGTGRGTGTGAGGTGGTGGTGGGGTGRGQQAAIQPWEAKFTKDDLAAIEPKPASANVPNTKQWTSIQAGLIKAGATDANFMKVLLGLSLEAFDRGSSEATTWDGTTEGVEHRAAANAIKESNCPIHKVTYYLAKPTFAIRQSRNLPPANYAKKNVPSQYKWCAFDAFDGLYDPTCLASELPYDAPSEIDRMAYATFKTIQIKTANDQKGFNLNYNPNVTQARLPNTPLPALPEPTSD
uniref:Coat protein n=1 Tax=Bamboo mosaic virus TaxID=35286 RepID=A0A286T3N5_9VIRU|nr:coat protein [Bamboo mosaic virus]